MKLRIFFAVVSAVLAFYAEAQRLAVLSDVHVSPNYANEVQLKAAVAEINAGDFDLVVMNGDLTNEGSDAELENVKSILDEIRHPLYVLPGNHENNWSQSATRTFNKLWGNDRFVAVCDSLVLIGINCGPYMKMGDGHVKQEDLHWLRAALDSVAVPGRRVLSFNHYPLLDDLDNCADYLAILQEYPVIGHINGHYHTWRTYNAGGDILGSELPCVMTRALDMRDGTYGYAVVEVTSDSVKVFDKAIGRDASFKFAFDARTDHKKAAEVKRRPVIVPDGYEVTLVWADSASVFTRLAFDDNNVYFGNSLGHARAVNKKRCTALWSVPLGVSLFSRPMVLPSGRIAFPGHDGIAILDSATGRQLDFIFSSEGPYVADGVLTPDGKAYIQGGYRRIECRNAATGAMEWSYDSIFNYCQGAPAIDGSDLVFGAWDTNLRDVDLVSGRLKWVWNNGKRNNMLGPGNVVPVITDDKVFIVAPDRYMTAIDRTNGTTLWRNNSHRFRESIGHSADRKRIYAKTMDGELVAVDATASEYKELWKTDLGIGYEHAPCLVVEHDGVVYVGSRRGILSMVHPEGAMLASLPLGVSEINGIDIDPTSGDVYVSLIEGTVFRIGRR